MREEGCGQSIHVPSGSNGLHQMQGQVQSTRYDSHTSLDENSSFTTESGAYHITAGGTIPHGLKQMVGGSRLRERPVCHIFGMDNVAQSSGVVIQDMGSETQSLPIRNNRKFRGTHEGMQNTLMIGRNQSDPKPQQITASTTEA